MPNFSPMSIIVFSTGRLSSGFFGDRLVQSKWPGAHIRYSSLASPTSVDPVSSVGSAHYHYVDPTAAQQQRVVVPPPASAAESELVA